MASVATLPSAAHAYHVYPAPPPTVNNLSSRQKAQLRRSTTKLSKVLGTTPHLVDTYPDPITVSAPRPLNSSSRHTSLQSSSPHSPPRRRLSHKRSKSERLHPDSYPLSASMQHQHRVSAPAAPRRLSVETAYPKGESSSKRPPTLQVHTPRSSHRYSNSVGVPYNTSGSSSRTTLAEDRGPVTHAIPRKPVPALSGQTPARDSLCDSLYEPTFTIPSESALRRAKLARVQKRLGEGVPINLIFPNDAGMEEESEDEGTGERDAKRQYNNDFVKHQRRASEQILPVEKTKTADEKRASSPSRYRILRLDRLSRDSKSSTSTAASSYSSSGVSNSSCSSSSSPPTPISSHPPSPISVSSHAPSQYSPPTPTAYSFHEYAADAGLASPVGRREFAVYVPRQHAVRRGSMAAGSKRDASEYELVRGFGNLGI